MNLIQQLIDKLRNKLSSRFIQNLGWLGIAEAFYRVLRLGLVVIMAQFLTPYDYGLAAIVMAVREFSITFSNVGIGAKIIQAEEKEVQILSNSAYWLNWVVFGSLFIIQCIVAFPIGWFYQSQSLILPICVSGIVYLVWPITGINKTLIQRENRFKIIAINDSISNCVATGMCAILAVAKMGVWAFVLPPVLIAPVEIFMYTRNHPWRPSKFTTKYWQEILSFGKNLLGVGLLKTLRNNLDYLIVGRFLGVEELGKYFFGFNAGLGISLSIINAINSAILPHLCAARSDLPEFRRRYFNGLKIISFIIIPLVILQSTLAPIYVPILAPKWVEAIPILMLICLSAIPRPFADAASQLLVAIGKPYLDLRWNILFTSIFAAALFVGVQWQAIGVAVSVLIVHIICLPLYSLWVTRFVFPKVNKRQLDS
ncbi:MAG: lipopolysaccharide biosynthesis protein [Cyanomargarita calcarea GSE-NOS-MK-12-04C]|uniref:Lipopolysaccharide biosynthesis protein n=1 Tax=Cyanomargarita calcarea GSE-NOS-MK-12-04C TaxID=2839659 RepID=A0A951QNJ7_9CYAN|nr:lipopolysaccharide biosynthesis protein [Cyanomargarita calcarea GSE-NOS-MK-12-04C]